MSIGLVYSEQLLDIPNARKLIIYCAEKFLHNINNDEFIKQQLKNHPFTINNIEVTLSGCTKEDKRSPPPNITSTMLSHGKIRYYTYENNQLKKVYEESYEDAKKIISEL